MKRHGLGKRILVNGLAVFLFTAANGAPPAAPDPWTQVPAFPTGCYSDQDAFAKNIAAALEALAGEITRQEKINSDLSKQFTSLGPAEIQSRMQTFMMSNPQEAMKMMQQNQAVSETYTDAGLKSHENWQKLEEELKSLQASYAAALDKALAPVNAKFKELDVRAQKDLVVQGESWVYAPWAMTEWNSLTKQSNAEYVKVCAAWWPASGQFHAWLKRYREHLVQDQIPPHEGADNAAVGFMVHLLDTPTASYKSTATMDAIHDYMKHASDVFSKRRGAPDKLR